jgi:hypothetical protein
VAQAHSVRQGNRLLILGTGGCHLFSLGQARGLFGDKYCIMLQTVPESTNLSDIIEKLSVS